MKRIKNDERHLGVMAYDEIKRSILKGDLNENERLTEIGLAEKLGVSRTPVREALKKLYAEGYITASDTGYKVSQVTNKDVMEIMDVRIALEAEAARRASMNISDEQKQDLLVILEQHRLLVNEPNREKRAKMLSAVDVQFHNKILTIAGNDRFLKILDSLRDRLYRSRIAAFTTDEDIRAFIEQHQNILNAIVSRDAEAASFYSRDHITKMKQRFGEYFSDNS